MQKQLIYKCIALLLIGLGLMIPLTMIQNTIEERNYFRSEAINRIAENSAGAQTLVGPLVVIPLEEDAQEQRSGDGGKTQHSVLVTYQSNYVLYPKRLDLAGQLKVEKRAYGLHEVPVFDLQGTLVGEFDPPAASDLKIAHHGGTVRIGTPRLVVGLADTRGIVLEPKIQFAQQTLKAERGTGLANLSKGFQAEIPLVLQEHSQRLPFRIELELAGTESFGMIPLADQTTASLASAWANPSFGGGFLPRERQVSDQGFTANWAVSSLAANVQDELLKHNGGELNGSPVAGSVEDLNSFRVTLIDPVDIYHQSVRAAKYGVLFIVLTFAAFFMFETVRNLPIHPIQYGLVGLSLALFFLLLLSLSEHLSFAWSYAASASACVLLNFAYLGTVLHSWRRASGFGGALALLYGYLYGVLLSEENALVLGALLLFAVLAALMLATRKVDWYRLQPAAPASA